MKYSCRKMGLVETFIIISFIQQAILLGLFLWNFTGFFIFIGKVVYNVSYFIYDGIVWLYRNIPSFSLNSSNNSSFTSLI